MTDTNLIIPSNPADIQKLKQMVNEATNCLTRIDAEREAKTEIVNEIVEQFELPKKMVNRLVTTQHKLNYTQQSDEAQDFSELYESIFGVGDSK